MFVIAIRDFGADEVGQVVGPFDTHQAAQDWVTRNKSDTSENDDPDAWYDIHELVKSL